VQGFNSGDQFYAYLKDSFDTLYAEGSETSRMMSIGLHCRPVGRPGRIASLERFIQYAKSHEAVWICRRVDIARHWHERHPFQQASALSSLRLLKQKTEEPTLINTILVSDLRSPASG
jgi:hypothetical protein